MRALIVTLSLVTVVFAGCAAPGDFAPPAEEEPTHVAEPAPTPQQAEEPTTEEPVADPEAPPVREVPVVTSILTTPYTAPVPIVLAAHDGEYADMQLWAGPEGIWCHATPKDDPMGTPPGYLAEGTWSSCTLSYEGENFTHFETASLALDAGMMTEIPVEAFTWSMEFGRLLQNNTGTYPEVLETMQKQVDPAPKADAYDVVRNKGLTYSNGYHEVCASPLYDGTKAITFVAEGGIGRTTMTINTGGREVQDIVPRNAPDTLEVVHDEANKTIVAWTDWVGPHRIVLDVTLQFTYDGGLTLALIPPGECPELAVYERESIPFTVTTEGIAGGWESADDHTAMAEVYGAT